MGIKRESSLSSPPPMGSQVSMFALLNVRGTGRSNLNVVWCKFWNGRLRWPVLTFVENVFQVGKPVQLHFRWWLVTSYADVTI
jgi:hypothetical protein